MVGVPLMDGVVGPAGSTARSSSTLSPPSSFERFVLAKPSYGPQYAQLYFCRLVQLRPAATAAAHAAWGPASPALRYADRVQSATATSDMDAAVVGVIFRDLTAKPSILREYGRAAAELIPAPPARTIATYDSGDPADRIILEDETGRFALDVSDVRDEFRHLVTGFIVAVRGRENRTTGTFKVAAVATVCLAPQPPLPELSADAFVCIVSGLGLGAPDFEGMLASELLLEYLRANVGDERDEGFSAKIVHLILAGNSVLSPKKLHDPFAIAAMLKPHLAVDSATQKAVAAPIVQLDRFLTSAAAAVPVSLMPGEHDPANYLLPQQPIHRCLLPSASRESNLHRVPNPYERAIDGRVFLGTSGQNVQDFVLYDADAAESVASACNASAARTGQSPTVGKHGAALKELADKECIMQEPVTSNERFASQNCSTIALDTLHAMLSNRHIAPTAPDTLGSYPFYERDPFVLESTPHVFFAGNQPEFGTRLWRTEITPDKPLAGEALGDGPAEAGVNVPELKDIRLVSVPRFDQTGLAALVNLRTLECTTVHFGDRVLSS
jgi:DNA polymerase delta subunit 2